MRNRFFLKTTDGFTLVEVLVGSAVFLVVALAAYGAFANLFRLANLNQARLIAVGLANERFEIVRNMPYASVGTVGGAPNGTIPVTQTLTRGGFDFTVDTVVRSIDLPFDGTVSGSPSDATPADNRLVEFTISCSSCQNFTPLVFTSQIAPNNLEISSPNNGSLIVHVFDAEGNALQGASVHVLGTGTSTVNLTDTTDNDGILQVLDIPGGVNLYNLTVTKSGYSTDRTYAASVSNPNPAKPDSTVIAQQATPISFAIDRTGSLTFNSVTAYCTTTPNVTFSLTGAKEMGQSLPKYSQNLSTGSGGTVVANSMEWDTYTVRSTGSSYDIAGVVPANTIALDPAQNQSVRLVVAEKNGNGLLVTVKAASDSSVLANSTIRLTGPGGYDQTIITDAKDVDGNPACAPIGQAYFGGLSTGAYDVTVTHAGYAQYTGSVSVSSSWQEHTVLLQ